MIKRLAFIFVFILSLFWVVNASAVSYPTPLGFVSDFGGFFTSQFRNDLEQNLVQFEAKTKTEIAVVTVESLEGEDVESYAVGLFEKWQIGKKGEDNGLLVLISKQEREIRIEVGYGLEPYITDGRAGEIIRNIITPKFKEGKYEEGILSAVEKLKGYIETKDVAPKEKMVNNSNIPIVPILFFGYGLLTYLGSFLGRTKTIWPGGVLGAIIGAIIGAVMLSVLGLFGGLVLGGLFGLLMDWFLSKNYKERTAKGLSTSFWGSGGGFRSSSGWGGGSSSGGGFGGFGGGSSGGGGASGKW